MKQRLAVAMIIVAAVSLPIVLTAAVFYASDAAIGGQTGRITPPFATTSKPKARTRHAQPGTGQPGGGSSSPAGGDG
ncbi:MAG TPA: hypothetical protein VE777_05180 [Gaiellales bacterium]|jgi:hypothetical protein|nr:hypothetical protein [Gaiellales bacterium]